MLSAEIIREQRDAEAETTCSVIVFTFNSFFFCFQFAPILYMLNYSVMYSLSERESGCNHGRNRIYLSKIENSSDHQELDL